GVAQQGLFANELQEPAFLSGFAEVAALQDPLELIPHFVTRDRARRGTARVLLQSGKLLSSRVYAQNNRYLTRYLQVIRWCCNSRRGAPKTLLGILSVAAEYWKIHTIGVHNRSHSPYNLSDRPRAAHHGTTTRTGGPNDSREVH